MHFFASIKLLVPGLLSYHVSRLIATALSNHHFMCVNFLNSQINYVYLKRGFYPDELDLDLKP